MLSDADAVFLHEAIIELPMIPPTGTGGQAIPRTGWRDDQLAHLVGLRRGGLFQFLVNFSCAGRPRTPKPPSNRLRRIGFPGAAAMRIPGDPGEGRR